MRQRAIKHRSTRTHLERPLARRLAGCVAFALSRLRSRKASSALLLARLQGGQQLRGHHAVQLRLGAALVWRAGSELVSPSSHIVQRHAERLPRRGSDHGRILAAGCHLGRLPGARISMCAAELSLHRRTHRKTRQSSPAAAMWK